MTRRLKGRLAVRLWITANATREKTGVILEETNSSSPPYFIYIAYISTPV
jgi:hypothetical protein